MQIAPANVKDEEKAIPQVDENQLKLEEEQRKVLASSQFSCYWDERCGFPPTPPEDLIHWSRFNSNIYSDEMSAKAALAAIMPFVTTEASIPNLAHMTTLHIW